MIAQQKNQRDKVVSATRLSLVPFYFFLLTSTAILPLSLMTPAFAQKSSSAEQRGFNLLKKGWVNDAIAAFQQALRSNPQSLQAKLGLAIGYKRAGKIDQAWNAYQQVLAQDPNNQLALKTIGLFGTYKPEWQPGGIKALSTLLQINPNDLEARNFRALLYSYQGRQNEAVADYEIVLASSNPSPETLLGAAQAYTYANNSSKAMELFNRYRATGKPVTGDAAVAYGRSLRESGNVGISIQVLEAQLQRSSGLDRTAIETRKELAVSYLANQQPDRAVEILQPLQGRPDAILPLARSLNEIRKSKNDPALASQIATLYRQALAASPNPPVSLVREVADVFTGLPNGGQTALQLYRQLVAQQPNDKSLLVRQLALENKLGLIARGQMRERLTSVLRTLPSDPPQQQQLGLALAEITTPDPEFLPIYQSLLQRVNAPLLYFRVAQMYLQVSDTNNARQALAGYTATPVGSKDLANQLLAAEIERREGNLDASMKRYQALLKSKPDRTEIYDAGLQGFAGLLRQQKRYDDAFVVYEQLAARNPQSQNLQLARTAIAYQAKRISEGEAKAVLENWLATQPATNTPPEFFNLVEVLPLYPEREMLYTYLAEVDPNNIPMQLRVVQALAQRSPAQARARVKQLMASLPQNANSSQLQAQLAAAAGDLKLAGKIYESILAQQPDNVTALAALGGIRFEQQRFDSAEQIYSQVLEQKPEDKQARRAVADLTAILDKPLSALAQMENLQLEQMRQGTPDGNLTRRMQQIQEDFLQRRGFQPAWEDYQRRTGK